MKGAGADPLADRQVSAEPRPNTILLVDDEAHVCASLSRILRRDGYRIFTANNLAEGLDVLARNAVDVVVSDQRMPGGTGTEFLTRVMSAYPATVRLILSGAAEIHDVTRAMETGAIYKFLTKPIDPGLFRANISEAFSRAASLLEGGAHEAARDAATGLPTRGYLERAFPSLLATALAGGQSVCVLALRVDQFEHVAASFGHSIGDAFLRTLATQLRRCLAQHHLLCHDTSGTFLLVTADDDVFDSIDRIESVLDEFAARPIAVAEHRITISITIGATTSQQESQTFAELADQARTAMLAASMRGGATLEIFEDRVRDALRGRLDLETDLRLAVAQKAFYLVYQPQVHIVTGEIVGLEVLARWAHPTRGLVSPKEFIPIAERLGLIHELGAWIIDSALAQFRGWSDSGRAPREVAVNVSPVQMQDGPFFFGTIRDALRRNGVDPASLVLEITESIAITEDEGIASCLAALRDLGVTLAVDDFGTGYSNLSNLTRFAFKKLKIDRSLLPREHDERGARLFANVVAMARELGLTVIAEGVETPVELATVHSAGCLIVQGYFYCSPVTPDRLNHLLGSRFPNSS